MHHEARNYSRSIHRGSGKEQDIKRPFATVGLVYLYFISEESSHIHYKVTGQQRHSVNLRQESVKVDKLRYSGIIFH